MRFRKVFTVLLEFLWVLQDTVDGAGTPNGLYRCPARRWCCQSRSDRTGAPGEGSFPPSSGGAARDRTSEGAAG
nr:hypothetical protein KPHV_08010 [Kitasatospora purpeofusca]